MSELISFLTLLFVFSSVLLLLLDRFSQPAIPAYIMAGVLLGLFFEQSQALGLSQIGIAFLVFIFGLQTEPERIRSVATTSLSTAFIQITVVGTGAYLFAAGFGLNFSNSLIFMAAASLSSSLIGLELIENEIRIDLLHGRLSESIHLIQDLVAVLVVLLVSAPGLQTHELVYHVARGIGIILLAIVVRYTIFPAVASRARNSIELTVITGLALLAGFAGLAEVLGISLVVGSFAAGIAAARFPFNLEMLETMSSLKDFFSAIFFASLGALISLPDTETLVIAFILAAGTIFVKPAVTAVALLLNGYDRRTSYLTALTLDQVSEFSLIIAIQAFAAGTITTSLFNAIILTATLTMITSAYTSRHEESIYRFISTYSRIDTTETKIKEWTDVDEGIQGHVILAGYDTQGRRIAESLRDEEQDFIVIENDPDKIVEAKENEANYIFGDVMDEKTWNKAGVDSAHLVVSTIPVKKISERILEVETDADIILRSENVEEASDLLEKGATYVEVPDIVASEEIVEHLQGVLENRNYREELRRKNLLELRKHIETGER